MYLSIDIETNYRPKKIAKPWVEGDYVSTVCIVTSEKRRLHWVFTHDEREKYEKRFTTDTEKINEIKAALAQAQVVIAHNAKFDFLWLRHLGLDPDSLPIFDTCVAEYLLNGQDKTVGFSLEETAKRRLNKSKDDRVKTDFWEKGIDTAQVPLVTLLEYNFLDCELALEIFLQQKDELLSRKMRKLAFIEMEKVKALIEIEHNGMKIDEEELLRQEQETSDQLTLVDTRIQEIAGFNFNVDSPEQLSIALFGGELVTKFKEKYIFTYKDGSTREKERWAEKSETKVGIFTPDPAWEGDKKGVYSTAKDILAQLKPQAKDKTRKELLSLLVERSALSQQLSTFLTGMKKHIVNGKIHPNINNVVTITGRLSSSGPNMQNIPRDKTAKVKKVFISELGELVEVDFKQLEWRAAAYLSQCPVMLHEIFNNIDQHAATGEQIFQGKGIRTDWKIFNFRMIYGGSGYSYFMDIKMPDFSLGRWNKIVDDFYIKYHGLADWHHRLVVATRKNKGQIISPTGRCLSVRKERTKDGFDYPRPKILNYPVQSFATADIVPFAMYHIRKAIKASGLEARLVNQVHDSILYDTKKENVAAISKIILDILENTATMFGNYYGFKVNVPFDGEAKHGPNWMEMTA